MFLKILYACNVKMKAQFSEFAILSLYMEQRDSSSHHIGREENQIDGKSMRKQHVAGLDLLSLFQPDMYTNSCVE